MAKTQPAPKKPSPAAPATPQPDFRRDRLPDQLLIGMFLLGMIATVAVLIAIAFFKKPPPVYLLLTPDGQITHDVTLDKPNLPENVMLNWLNDTLTSSLTFNFKNVQRVLDRVRPNYTSVGYAAYTNYLNTNNILQDLQQQKWVYNCFATSAPQIQDEHVVNDRYTWTILMPVRVMMDSVTQNIPKVLRITATVVRVPTLIAPLGFQIDGFSVENADNATGGPSPPPLG